MLKELVHKIEHQSIVVLFITLLAGVVLLRSDPGLSTAAGIMGVVLLASAVLYTFVSFFSNHYRESYRDLITEYKSQIRTLKSMQKFTQKSYESTITNREDSRMAGRYRSLADTDDATHGD